jgi:hypothetical protein
VPSWAWGPGLACRCCELRAVWGPASISPSWRRTSKGTWISTEITSDEWVDGLLALGHDRDDVEFALANFPPFERARWRLTFVDAHLQIFGSFDGGGFYSMSGGPYELLPDGSIRYDDFGCILTIRVVVDGPKVDFGPMTTESCNADERLNNDGFFQLVEYEREVSP